MKNRIKKLQEDKIQIENEVMDYIKEYAELNEHDKLEYNAVFNYITVTLQYIGTTTIWKYDNITDLKISMNCSEVPDTIEEFQQMQKSKLDRKNTLNKVFIAFKYIIDK